MSTTQLHSFYEPTPEDLHQIYCRETLLRTTSSPRTSKTKVEFLTLSKKVLHLDDQCLAHRCGTGRMQHLIEIVPSTEP